MVHGNLRSYFLDAHPSPSLYFESKGDDADGDRATAINDENNENGASRKVSRFPKILIT